MALHTPSPYPPSGRNPGLGCVCLILYSCRPTGRAPWSKPAGRLKCTAVRAGRTSAGGRTASPLSPLDIPSGSVAAAFLCGLVQLPPTRRRAQRGEAAVNRRKIGVGSHCHGHFPAKVKRSPPTNVATADAMGCGFSREESGFHPNSGACRRQLRLRTSGAVKLLLVTGKRGRRRRDMGRGPLGPVL